MSTYDAVKDLPLEIEGYDLEPLEQEVAADFTLRRTASCCAAAAWRGAARRSTTTPAPRAAFQARRGELPFAGQHTLDSFSLLQAGQGEYRRWAFESAALDLALKQAGLSLAEAIGRPQRPLRFVVSTRVAKVEEWLALEPRPALQARPRPRLGRRT